MLLGCSLRFGVSSLVPGSERLAGNNPAIDFALSALVESLQSGRTPLSEGVIWRGKVS
jgi:hypothetical protein